MAPKSAEVAHRTVDSYVHERMRDDHIPGLALAILKDGAVIFQQGYGFANLECRVPVTADSVFEICSISKQFTVVATMLLVEAGALGLDEAIGALMPDLPESWQAVTVRQLLTATSGIPDYLNDLSTDAATMQETSAKIVEYVSAFDMRFPVGERWSYNNTGFVLLGMIIAQRSGVSYRDFLKTQISTPLEMHTTYANDLRLIIPNRVAGYTWDDDVFHNRQVFFAGKRSDGDGELVSTLADLIKWEAVWRGERLLSRASLQQIWTPATVNDGTLATVNEGDFATTSLAGSHYGFGWFLSEHQGHRVYWTPGAGEGFSTSFMRFPDADMSIIVLCNRRQFLWADSLARSIGELMW